MKKIILLLVGIVALTMEAYAQFRMDPNGNTSFASSETALSVISVNSGGDPTYKVYAKADDRGYYCDRRGYNSSWGMGFYGFSHNEDTNFSLGVRGDAYSYTVQNSGRSFGVFGTAGNATSGWNYGVFGRIDGANNGAAVYGTTSAFENGSFINGKYAGYFNGNTKIVGNLNVTGNVSGIMLTPAPDASATSYVIPEEFPESCTKKICDVDVLSYYIKESNTDILNNSDTILKVPLPNDSETQNLEKRHLGISSKTLAEVFPDLVYKMDDGYEAINYTELIPVLLQSIKELNARIAYLEGKNEYKSKSTAASLNMIEENTVLLSQNTPNPCSENTLIKINVPIGEGKLILNNSNGLFIREYPLHSGENTINIDTSCLSNGTYLYRTEIRGIKSDCKRMIIAR